jgi:hypothetical protein
MDIGVDSGALLLHVFIIIYVIRHLLANPDQDK